MCAYNMKIPDKYGKEYVYKPAQFLTNSSLLAAQLERKCDKKHVHSRLEGNRTKQARSDHFMNICEEIRKKADKENAEK